MKKTVFLEPWLKSCQSFKTMMSDDHYLTFLEPLSKHLVLQHSFALLFKDDWLFAFAFWLAAIHMNMDCVNCLIKLILLKLVIQSSFNQK